MGRIVPKYKEEDSWQPLIQHRDFAVLCNEGESVYFRFGQGRGMYLSTDSTPSGYVINGIDYETGGVTLLGKLSKNHKTVLGRTSECTIKVMHAIVSRQHIELTLNNNILMVRDLGSTNGTYLLKEIPHFDVEQYLEDHPPKDSHESTMDWVHETFGLNIDEFLKSYSQTKKESK